MNWSARSDLHAQGCLILSQVGLLFPVNHAPKSWCSWRDSHPLVIRRERATARRLCAQEQLTLGRDGRIHAGSLLDVTEPLSCLSYVPRWPPRMDSHHQHPASETGVLLIELRGNKMVEPRGVAPQTSTMRACWRTRTPFPKERSVFKTAPAPRPVRLPWRSRPDSHRQPAP
jgi:hypothetical protein